MTETPHNGADPPEKPPPPDRDPDATRDDLFTAGAESDRHPSARKWTQPSLPARKSLGRRAIDAVRRSRKGRKQTGSADTETPKPDTKEWLQREITDADNSKDPALPQLQHAQAEADKGNVKPLAQVLRERIAEARKEQRQEGTESVAGDRLQKLKELQATLPRSARAASRVPSAPSLPSANKLAERFLVREPQPIVTVDTTGSIPKAGRWVAKTKAGKFVAKMGKAAVHPLVGTEQGRALPQLRQRREKQVDSDATEPEVDLSAIEGVSPAERLNNYMEAEIDKFVAREITPFSRITARLSRHDTPQAQEIRVREIAKRGFRTALTETLLGQARVDALRDRGGQPSLKQLAIELDRALREDPKLRDEIDRRLRSLNDTAAAIGRNQGLTELANRANTLYEVATRLGVGSEHEPFTEGMHVYVAEQGKEDPDTNIPREQSEDARLEVPEKHFVGVLDGMGGHAGGATASRLGREVLERKAAELPDGLTAQQREEALSQMLVDASNTIRAESTRRGQPEDDRMGTTAVVGQVWQDADGKSFFTYANVGDSPAYLFRNGQLEMLTVDDSTIIHDLAAKYNLSPDEVRSLQIRMANYTGTEDGSHLTDEEVVYFRIRNRIAQSLGSETITPHTGTRELQPGDRLLLASDGTDSLTLEQMQRIIAEAGDAPGEGIANRLVSEAALASRKPREENVRTHRDDITVQVIDIGPNPAARQATIGKLQAGAGAPPPPPPPGEGEPDSDRITITGALPDSETGRQEITADVRARVDAFLEQATANATGGNAEAVAQALVGLQGGDYAPVQALLASTIADRRANLPADPAQRALEESRIADLQNLLDTLSPEPAGASKDAPTPPEPNQPEDDPVHVRRTEARIAHAAAVAAVNDFVENLPVGVRPDRTGIGDTEYNRRLEAAIAELGPEYDDRWQELQAEANRTEIEVLASLRAWDRERTQEEETLLRQRLERAKAFVRIRRGEVAGRIPAGTADIISNEESRQHIEFLEDPRDEAAVRLLLTEAEHTDPRGNVNELARNIEQQQVRLEVLAGVKSRPELAAAAEALPLYESFLNGHLTVLPQLRQTLGRLPADIARRELGILESVAPEDPAAIRLRAASGPAAPGGPTPPPGGPPRPSDELDEELAAGDEPSDRRAAPPAGLPGGSPPEGPPPGEPPPPGDGGDGEPSPEDDDDIERARNEAYADLRITSELEKLLFDAYVKDGHYVILQALGASLYPNRHDDWEAYIQQTRTIHERANRTPKRENEQPSDDPAIQLQRDRAVYIPLLQTYIQETNPTELDTLNSDLATAINASGNATPNEVSAAERRLWLQNNHQIGDNALPMIFPGIDERMRTPEPPAEPPGPPEPPPPGSEGGPAPERERTRQEWVDKFRDEAEGTVGINYAAGFTPSEVDAFRANAEQRNEGRPPEKSGTALPDTGGEHTFGDRQGAILINGFIGGRLVPILNSFPPEERRRYDEAHDASDHEQIFFAPDPDGNNVTVYYRFNHRNYLNRSNRPGEMKIAFSLPRASADQLLGLVHDDPSILNDVIKAQALNTGFPPEAWDVPPGGGRKMEPNFGFDPRPADHKLTIISSNDNGATYGFEDVGFDAVQPLGTYRRTHPAAPPPPPPVPAAPTPRPEPVRVPPVEPTEPGRTPATAAPAPEPVQAATGPTPDGPAPEPPPVPGPGPEPEPQVEVPAAIRDEIIASRALARANERIVRSTMERLFQDWNMPGQFIVEATGERAAPNRILALRAASDSYAAFEQALEAEGINHRSRLSVVTEEVADWTNLQDALNQGGPQALADRLQSILQTRRDQLAQWEADGMAVTDRAPLNQNIAQLDSMQGELYTAGIGIRPTPEGAAAPEPEPQTDEEMEAYIEAKIYDAQDELERETQRRDNGEQQLTEGEFRNSDGELMYEAAVQAIYDDVNGDEVDFNEALAAHNITRIDPVTLAQNEVDRLNWVAEDTERMQQEIRVDMYELEEELAEENISDDDREEINEALDRLYSYLPEQVGEARPEQGGRIRRWLRSRLNRPDRPGEGGPVRKWLRRQVGGYPQEPGAIRLDHPKIEARTARSILEKWGPDGTEPNPRKAASALAYALAEKAWEEKEQKKPNVVATKLAVLRIRLGLEAQRLIDTPTKRKIVGGLLVTGAGLYFGTKGATIISEMVNNFSGPDIVPPPGTGVRPSAPPITETSVPPTPSVKPTPGPTNYGPSLGLPGEPTGTPTLEEPPHPPEDNYAPGGGTPDELPHPPVDTIPSTQPTPGPTDHGPSVGLPGEPTGTPPIEEPAHPPADNYAPGKPTGAPPIDEPAHPPEDNYAPGGGTNPQQPGPQPQPGGGTPPPAPQPGGEPQPQPGGEPLPPVQLTPDQLQQEFNDTFAQFSHEVKPNEGYSKIIAEYINQSPLAWDQPAENGVTKGAVVADMLSDFAKQNGVDLPTLHPGEIITPDRLAEYHLTPDQLQVLHEALNTDDVQSYLDNVQDRFQAVKAGTPLSDLQPITPDVPDTPVTPPTEIPDELNDSWSNFNHEAVRGDTRSEIYRDFFRDNAEALGGNWQGGGTSKAALLSDMWWHFQQNHGVQVHDLDIGAHVTLADWNTFTPDEQQVFLRTMNSTSYQDYAQHIRADYENLIGQASAPDAPDAGTGGQPEAQSEAQLSEAQPIKVNLPAGGGEYTIDIPQGTTPEQIPALIDTHAAAISDAYESTIPGGLPHTISEFLATNIISQGLEAQGIDIDIPRPDFDPQALAQELNSLPEINALMNQTFHHDGQHSLWETISSQLAPIDSYLGWKPEKGYNPASSILTDVFITNGEKHGFDVNNVPPGDYTLADMKVNSNEISEFIARLITQSSASNWSQFDSAAFTAASKTW